MFKNILPVAALAVMVAVPTFAQPRRGPGYGYPGNGYPRDGRYENSYRTGGYANPVTAAMRDLEFVFRRARVDNHEANHFRRALDELSDFQQRAARGRFDRGKLDHALDNMSHLARADQLHPRDRQLIFQRMQDLRYFRDRGPRY